MFPYFSVYKLMPQELKLSNISCNFFWLFGKQSVLLHYFLINYKEIIYFLMKVNNSMLHNKVNVIQEGVFHFNYFYQCIRCTSLTYSDFTVVFEKMSLPYMLGNVVFGFNILLTTATAFRDVAFRIYVFSFIFSLHVLTCL